eukprot:TRINITY_DN1612_c0_g1_i1.p1 TRINITY_DN1612_c0_g1~~TRINITY_DN1612_c0_g1_i1.p1  ORF type:complete len:372 (-),score=87.15 TRINITY_DN1612_c0_g1_i1:901-2016(-)
MEGEEDGGLRLSKRIAKGEVDYSNKAGTAWSHSYLNQKPWHPLSYPNQKRKWIAEQIHSQKQRRAEEVAREFAQEQDFFRQTAAISKKEKEKVELMQAVSFMYARPPGYNAESAKAAEMADENKKHFSVLDDQKLNGLSNTGGDGFANTKESHIEEKKKPRPKDLYGRPIPTEEEFEVLKNAPRLETGIAVRAKPFGVEIRNVKCLRCGAFGHQSGDRECPMKDAIMPNEESRLKRDDPLTAMMACTESDEPSKWKLKQQPGGISPPRGGFKSDDPNQQIIPEEIFDEYGGFLNGEAAIPELLFNYHEKPSKTSRSRKDKSKHKSSRAAADHAYRKESTETDMKDNTKRNHKSEKEASSFTLQHIGRLRFR